MYQPTLRVERGDDGLVIVHAVTPTPNTCHSAGEPRPETSDGSEVGIPENRAFVLPIERTDGPCGAAITPVRHQFTVLPQPGKRVVTVMTTLDGKEVGSGSITLPEIGDESRGEPDDEVPRRRSDAAAILGAGEWHAFVDPQPGGDPLFYVEGLLTLGHPGYEVGLTASGDSREDGQVNRTLTVEERDGLWIQVPVRYEQRDPPNPREIETAVVRLADTDETVTVDVRSIR
jgi:hypothetical protein